MKLGCKCHCITSLLRKIQADLPVYGSISVEVFVLHTSITFVTISTFARHSGYLGTDHHCVSVSWWPEASQVSQATPTGKGVACETCQSNTDQNPEFLLYTAAIVVVMLLTSGC